MKVLKKMFTACIRRLGYDVYRIDRFRLTSLSNTPGPDYEKTLEDNSAILRNLHLDKAHYGCGPLLFGNGWINVDFNPKRFGMTEPYLRLDLTSKHPLPSGCFSFSFAEDFLEHLTQDESLIFLSEAFRCLKTGGVLRLSFPGLRGVLQRHYRQSDYDGAAKGQEEAFTMWDHKHFYCEESLSLVARHLGFSEVRLVSFGTSEHKELNGLDSRGDQQDLNLYVELTK